MPVAPNIAAIRVALVVAEANRDRWVCPDPGRDRHLSTMLPPALQPLMIDSWRIATWPWRALASRRAKRQGTWPVAILFWHRVADDRMNDWTIGTEAFCRQIDWLEKHFEIVPLAEAQRRIRSGHNRVPTVCLTFDDGYADNSAQAIPMLMGRGIPFTYFVATEHVRRAQPFPHDVARGEPLEPNSIEVLRAMAQAGVEIGGHTRNHANLGAIADPDLLYDEVIGAAHDLEKQIGRPVRYFAFPYGQLENLNGRVFALARQHGFAGVCSAYGGWNEIGGDAFHLQRFSGDPELARIRNWLTLDPRKRHAWQTPHVERMIAAANLEPAKVPEPIPPAAPFPAVSLTLSPSDPGRVLP
jgi:peptidoglycan/xylan/chitin deacetylase (PgdA/CDA1 family)